MRFYRIFFWIAVLLHLCLAAWLCLAPDYALRQLGHDATRMPLIYLQEHGLFMFIHYMLLGKDAKMLALYSEDWLKKT